MLIALCAVVIWVVVGAGSYVLLGPYVERKKFFSAHEGLAFAFLLWPLSLPFFSFLIPFIQGMSYLGDVYDRRKDRIEKAEKQREEKAAEDKYAAYLASRPKLEVEGLKEQPVFRQPEPQPQPCPHCGQKPFEPSVREGSGSTYG
jgi:hypothetical protein